MGVDVRNTDRFFMVFYVYQLFVRSVAHPSVSMFFLSQFLHHKCDHILDKLFLLLLMFTSTVVSIYLYKVHKDHASPYIQLFSR